MCIYILHQKEEAKISLRLYSLNHIDLKVGGVGEEVHWRLTFFYGHPIEAEHYKSWELLQRLKETSSLPWCCLGDFNEVLQAFEQDGGDVRSERQMEGFRNTITNCELQNMGFVGNKFTWAMTKGGGIKVWLDRRLATQSWIDLFPAFRLVHLKPTSSDHIPILLEWEVRKMAKFKKSFRYKDGWSVRDGCETMVKRW